MNATVNYNSVSLWLNKQVAKEVVLYARFLWHFVSLVYYQHIHITAVQGENVDRHSTVPVGIIDRLGVYDSSSTWKDHESCLSKLFSGIGNCISYLTSITVCTWPLTFVILILSIFLIFVLFTRYSK